MIRRSKFKAPVDRGGHRRLSSPVVSLGGPGVNDCERGRAPRGRSRTWSSAPGVSLGTFCTSRKYRPRPRDIRPALVLFGKTKRTRGAQTYPASRRPQAAFRGRGAAASRRLGRYAVFTPRLFATRGFPPTRGRNTIALRFLVSSPRSGPSAISGLRAAALRRLASETSACGRSCSTELRSPLSPLALTLRVR